MHAMERLAEAARGLRGVPAQLIEIAKRRRFRGGAEAPSVVLDFACIFRGGGSPPLYPPTRMRARWGRAHAR